MVNSILLAPHNGDSVNPIQILIFIGSSIWIIEAADMNGTSIKALWENRTEYVGNNSAVGNILGELSFSNDMIYDYFELKTDIEPYGITIHFNAAGNALAEIDENETALSVGFGEFETNAKIMFSLIGNVNKIMFEIHRENGASLMAYYQTFFPIDKKNRIPYTANMWRKFRL